MLLHTLNSYKPIIIIILGLAGWLSSMGVGINLLDILKIKLPSPWKQVVGLSLGLLTLSLVVQITAMAGYATKNILTITAILIGIAGAYGILRSPNRLIPSGLGKMKWFDITLICLISVLLITNLLVASTPSTKIDELYYHMLLPERILHDGRLIFYRVPLESAIYPQMLLHIANTVYYAIGFADAPNVLSWCISLTLTWFIWYIVAEKAIKSLEEEYVHRGVSVAFLCSASIIAGLYTVVWHVTGGAHAFGDFAMTSLIVLLFFQTKLENEWGPAVVCFVGGVSGVAAAGVKVTILPLVALCSCILIFSSWKNNRKISPIKSGLLVLIPWVIFYTPLMVWTFLESGSPFGPMLAGIGNWSIYQVSWVHQNFAYSKSINSQLNIPLLIKSVTYYSPLIWTAIIFGIFSRWPDKVYKYIFLCLFFLQIAIIIILLPLDLRFLGGIQFGILCIMGTLFLKGEIIQLLKLFKVKLLLLIILLPWSVLQVYYAIPFIKVVLGLTPPGQWCEEKVPLCNDFIQLDRILPSNAQILAKSRLASIYSPRPIYYDINDIKSKDPIYAVYIGDPDSSGLDIGSCSREGLAYYDHQAKIQVYRTPGQPPEIGEIYVYQIDCRHR
jgi:hypothetical protein